MAGTHTHTPLSAIEHQQACCSSTPSMSWCPASREGEEGRWGGGMAGAHMHSRMLSVHPIHVMEPCVKLSVYACLHLHKKYTHAHMSACVPSHVLPRPLASRAFSFLVSLLFRACNLAPHHCRVLQQRQVRRAGVLPYQAPRILALALTAPSHSRYCAAQFWGAQEKSEALQAQELRRLAPTPL